MTTAFERIQSSKTRRYEGLRGKCSIPHLSDALEIWTTAPYG
jgi:hypothetical protein